MENNQKIVVKVLVLYYTYCDAINSYGNRSGSEDSSLNICYLCASLFLGDVMKDKYMNEALKEAMKAYELNEVPIGAVIVKDNKIIAKGYNMKNSLNNVLKHAELIAIENAQKKLKNWRLDDCELYVTLEPCPMCASAIQQSRIKKVYYSLENRDVENHKIIQLIFRRNGTNKEVLYEKISDSAEVKEIMKKFFCNKR